MCILGDDALEGPHLFAFSFVANDVCNGVKCGCVYERERERERDSREIQERERENSREREI